MLDIPFGTDGIRGEVGIHPITSEAFMRLGYAVGTMLKDRFEHPSVIIGKDTRLSGYMLESSLQSGLLASGTDVGLLGPMPTPAIAYLTKTYYASAGGIISASHNTWSDNGVKFFSHLGTKFSETEQEQITKILQQDIKVDGKKIGKAVRHTQAIGRYIEFCKASFNRALHLNSLTIVVDTAHGATYHIASAVFKELGAKVITINDKPNGMNINHNCGSTAPEKLAKVVLEQQADIGIAFDGDGDRVILVDHKGNVIDGDEILYIIAKYYKEQHRLTNDVVIGTQMTNIGIRNALMTNGMSFIEAKVGDRFVLEEMHKNNAVLGGEGSGHIICSEHTSTGDGIIAALQILEVMRSYDESLHAISKQVTKYPQLLNNVKISPEFILEDSAIMACKHDLELAFAGKGRVLIRKSGTESLLRVMVEHIDLATAKKSMRTLLDTL